MRSVVLTGTTRGAMLDNSMASGRVFGEAVGKDFQQTANTTNLKVLIVCVCEREGRGGVGRVEGEGSGGEGREGEGGRGRHVH